MQSRERVITTLYHETPDMVPFFDFLYNEISLRRILGETKPIQMDPERYMKAQLALGFDHVCMYFDAPKGSKRKWLTEGTFLEEWGWKFKILNDMSWYIDGTIKTPEDLENLQPPDPHAPGRTRTIRKLIKKYGDKLSLGVAVGGPFTHAWMMTGFNVFVKMMYTNPSFIHKIMNLYNKSMIELGKIAIDEGVEFIWISDDLGDKNGPMIMPKHFRIFVLPYIREQVEAFKQRGVWVFLHCDGNVNAIMEDIVNTGIDAFHPCQRSAHMNLAELKEKYGDRITLFGNVDSSNLIPFGTYEEIDQQIKECFSVAAPGGGYIFGSDHSIHPGIPADRARFLFQRAQKYRRYPIRRIDR